MNPIFTLNYPELLLAEYLQKHFEKKGGYSVLMPLSGQQKGYDLALMRRAPHGTKVVTFQVKSSRTYTGSPGVSPRTKTRTFAHNMWLRTFAVPPEADFFVLLGLYAPNPTSLKNATGVWQSHMLLFTRVEMAQLMNSLRQRRTTAPETHFGFGFDDAAQAFLNRGHAQAQHPDYSGCLLSGRHAVIQAAL